MSAAVRRFAARSGTPGNDKMRNRHATLTRIATVWCRRTILRRALVLAGLAGLLILLGMFLRGHPSRRGLRSLFRNDERDLFGVVVPIAVQKEEVSLRALLRYWDSSQWPNGTWPCPRAAPPGSPRAESPRHAPDLVVFSAQPLEEEAKRRLRSEFQSGRATRQCFRELRFASCGLGDRVNVYKMSWDGFVVSEYNGPLLMFLCATYHRELYDRYQYALWMEPDVVPVRGNWLHAVEQEALRAASEGRLAVQGGCTPDKRKRYDGWRNGSPALYQLGKYASMRFRDCFEQLHCKPMERNTCNYAWDAYLYGCGLLTEQWGEDLDNTCRFLHVGSAWQGLTDRFKWDDLRNRTGIDKVVLFHSAHVLHEAHTVLEKLHESVREGDRMGTSGGESRVAN